MKPLFVISCPIDTYSGYGGRSRDLVKAIIETGKYDVRVLPQRWGNTPWGFLEENSEWTFMKKYVLQNPQLPKQPDVWMQITIPNEFQPVGKYNIGVTAGIETTVAHHTWIEGMNRMNLVLVSSEFSKKALVESKYDAKDANGNSAGTLECTVPIEVVFEGADLNTYFENLNATGLDLSIEEDFAYLFVGHWLQGDYSEDRKNVGLLIKAFYETFKNKRKKPALILKTSSANTSYMDRDMITKRIQDIRDTCSTKDLPNIYLLHGDFSDAEMNDLYNHPKVKAMVSITKGEGFGRPLLEFSLTKKPVIASNWSGHTDFLLKEFSILLNGDLTQVHPSAAVENMILTEAQWFSVNHGELGHYLRDVFENYKTYKNNANRQAYRSKTEFSWDKMKEKLEVILDSRLPEFPKEIQLQLPKLKKIELPKRPTNG
jgi:glycosyltransferase involved in cell wall biosynthesis